MILFYSGSCGGKGKEPEEVLGKGWTVMLTFWNSCKKKAEPRFRRIRKARRDQKRDKV